MAKTWLVSRSKKKFDPAILSKAYVYLEDDPSGERTLRYLRQTCLSEERVNDYFNKAKEKLYGKSF